MQGGSVSNQTTSRLQESQAMLYASAAIECLKLRGIDKDKSLETGVQHRYTNRSVFVAQGIEPQV
jgi:hypothetical protein